MEEASYLAKMCSEVFLIHRRDVFKASNIMLERAKKNPKIKFMVPYDVEKPLSDNTGLTGVLLKNSDTGKTEELKVDGLFMAIGHTPNSKIFRDFVDTDANGYIKTIEFAKTKTPGVFSAGDISDSIFRQAVTAAGMGCQAAIQALKYAEEQE
jgi:thioredoxin reductase (NADPH)